MVGSVSAWAELPLSYLSGTTAFNKSYTWGSDYAKNKVQYNSGNTIMMWTNGNNLNVDSNGKINSDSGLAIGNSSKKSAFVFRVEKTSDISVSVGYNSSDATTYLYYLGTTATTLTDPNNMTIGEGLGTLCATATVTLSKTNGAAGYYMVISTLRFLAKSITITAVSSDAAPGKPTFTVDGGNVEGNSTTTIASENASAIYYCWSESSTAPEKGNEAYYVDYNDSYVATVPNVTGTRYLHAYGYNTYNTSSTSDIKSAMFNITKVKEAAGLTYAIMAVTKYTDDAAFTNTLTNPNGLTVSYASGNTDVATVDAESGEVTIVAAGTTTITATSAATDDYNAGEAIYTLTVNALVVQSDVTGAKTWNIETDVTSGADVHTDGVYKLYANIAGLTFAETFDASSLLVKATSSNTAYRMSYKCAQGANLKFHTTVPGIVTVTFQNPSNKDTRYLQVNATNYDGSDGSKITASSGVVSAGDIEITGSGSLRFFKIVFTP